MDTVRMRVNRNARFKKLDPVQVYYSPLGRLKITRWRPNMNPQWANGTVMADIPAGAEVTVTSVDNNNYEIRP